MPLPPTPDTAMAQEDSISTALLYLHILRSIPKRRKTTVREIHSQLQALG